MNKGGKGFCYVRNITGRRKSKHKALGQQQACNVPEQRSLHCGGDAGAGGQGRGSGWGRSLTAHLLSFHFESEQKSEVSRCAANVKGQNTQNLISLI